MSEVTLNCVLLADRHQVLMEGMRGLLSAMARTVVMVADEASLLDGASQLQPEVVVVDLSISSGGSLRWLHELRSRCPQARVIVLSVHDEASVRRTVLEAGADGFVLKRAVAAGLLPAIEAALAGPAVA
jgi:DNA-binding NarL/FixJ family response regulator